MAHRVSAAWLQCSRIRICSLRKPLVGVTPRRRTSAFLAKLLPILTSATVPTNDFGPSSTSTSRTVLELSTGLLRAALPFVPEEGFTLQAIRKGVDADPGLAKEDVIRRAFAYGVGAKGSDGAGARAVDIAWLEGLFPSGGESSRTIFDRFADRRRSQSALSFDDRYSTAFDGATNEDHQLLGLRRALVSEWLAQGRREAATYVQDRAFEVAKDGEGANREGYRERLRYNDRIGAKRVSEALALHISRPPMLNSTTFPLIPHLFRPLPLPHLYIHECLSLSTTLLGALKDYSESGEWQMRRLRYGLVWGAVELASLREPEGGREATHALLDRLLVASAKTASGVRDTLEFLDYVRRSQAAIWKSFGL